MKAIIIAIFIVIIIAILISMGMKSRTHVLELDIPLDCTLGKDCIIQNYVDQKEGEAWQDYQCRNLSYDGHKGTDFRAPVFKPAGGNLKVLAAADGVVRNFRDGEPDGHAGRKDKAIFQGKECGNGLALQHEGGWETQYCHMKKGSVAVTQGQQVKKGDILGEIGLSGHTAFPHLHLSVRNPEGKPVDPFNARPMESGCDEPKASLWSDAAKKVMVTEKTGYLASGIASKAVKVIDLIEGKHQERELDAQAPALVFWSLLYGVEQGDALSMVLLDPDAKVFVQNTDELKAAKVQYMQFIGKKRSDNEPWPKGDYEAIVTLVRDGRTIIDESITFQVR